MLDLGLDPDELTQVGHIAEQNWSAGGPLFQAVVLNRIEMARLLLDRGADPNASVWTSGSPTYRAYEGRNPEMIALLEQYGGWIDPGSAGYARQTEIACKMLAGEIDPHLEPNEFLGPHRGRTTVVGRRERTLRRDRPHDARTGRLAAG